VLSVKVFSNLWPSVIIHDDISLTQSVIPGLTPFAVINVAVYSLTRDEQKSEVTNKNLLGGDYGATLQRAEG
jgi:hypothetical protein